MRTTCLYCRYCERLTDSIQRCRDFVHEHAGIQFAQKVGHYGHAVIIHR
ncbi:hypothetical protein KCP76_24920 [Salmonella enterica subsp. enterica serovar Weltevreden]|nr:hypothetical protein KCP76_24920 [Salmonella enterica subsp. enterica serovar Weltevreden]